MTDAEVSGWHDIYFTGRDGLRLHARRYGPASPEGRPVLCLPGLTRNAKDFHTLAQALAQSRRLKRTVYCVDYRGRGRSDRDPEWRNYSPYIECLDALDLMTREGLEQVAVIGTSRGGLIAMIMAVLRPTALGAVVLNDIGPVIERDGFTRIASYVGRIPLPPGWPEAAALVRDMNKRFFPQVREAEWLEIAKAWFNEDGGAPAQGFDPELARSIAMSAIDGALPTLWPQFKALAATPTLVLRGELSDLLSAATVAAMAKAHPLLESRVVAKEGHAPLLRDKPTIEAIIDFLARSDLHQPSRARAEPMAAGAA